MDTNDKQAIEGLFTKLGDVERTAGPRDAEAEGFIADRLRQQPGAPYYMAQTIVMQEMALEAAQREIEELRRQPTATAQESGGLLSRLFGGGQSPQPRAPTAPMSRTPAATSGPWNGQSQGAQPGQMQQGRSGGGFMAGAAQTAMGVAGGVLLGNAIGGMFGGNEAQAAEPTPAEPHAEPDNAAADEPAADEGGGFFDSFGGDEEF